MTPTPRNVRRSLALAASLALVLGCQQAQVLVPAKAPSVVERLRAAAPWEHPPLATPMAQPSYPFHGTDAPVVQVKANVAALWQMLKQSRHVMGLGFNEAAIASMRLRAIGPGILDVDHVEATFNVGATNFFPNTPPNPQTTLGVKAGPNRVFYLDGLDAAGNVIARLRTVSAVTIGQQIGLTFNYNTDVAGRILEDILVRTPAQTAGYADFAPTLETNDLSAMLLAYAANFTGFTDASNTFTGTNPLYFKDWVVAASLIALGADTGAEDTFLAGFTNPGTAHSAADVTDEYRPALVFHLPAPVSGTFNVQVLDPVDRGAFGNNPPVDNNNQAIFQSVPPGEYTVKVTNGANTETFDLFVPFDATAHAFDVNVGTFTAGGLAVPVQTMRRPDPPPQIPTPPPALPPPLFTVTTVVGGTVGYFDSNDPKLVQINAPTGMVMDDQGLVFSDYGNMCVRRMNLQTGAVQTIAGNPANAVATNGNLATPIDALAATYFAPYGVGFGQGIYIVADTNEGPVDDQLVDRLVVDPNQAGHLLESAVASGSHWYGAAVHRSAPRYYVSDNNNNLIRELDMVSNAYTGRQCAVTAPRGLAIDDGGNVYVASAANCVVKIGPTMIGSVLAGSPGASGNVQGPAGAARFNQPHAVACSRDGTRVWVADEASNQITELAQDANHDLQVTAIAGDFSAGQGGNTDAVGTNARFQNPQGLAYDEQGYLYVADSGNSRIRKIYVGLTPNLPL